MSTVKWGKPTLEICKLAGGEIPAEAKWDVLDNPVEDSTQLTTTKGSVLEARGEGGELIDSYTRPSAYSVVFELYAKRDSEKPIEDEDGVVKDAFGFDGWAVDQTPTPHGFPRIPVAYDRYGGPFWANSQSNIENYELTISQLAENNAAYALRILYALGGEIEMSATLDGTPTRIDSVDPSTKIGFLEPSDSSRSFELQLTTLEKSIMKSSFASETPELKSGSDLSSLTVRTLLMDSYQKALLDAQHLQPFLDDVVELFKYGYAMEIGKSSDYENFKVKGEIFPYVFMSETEQVSNIVQLRAAGALSKQTASEMAYELGYGVVSESERLAKEAREELEGTQQTQNTQKGNVVNAARNQLNGQGD